MCWNKGRLCWKIAKLFYFCHLKKLVSSETFGPYYVYFLYSVFSAQLAGTQTRSTPKALLNCPVQSSFPISLLQRLDSSVCHYTDKTVVWSYHKPWIGNAVLCNLVAVTRLNLRSRDAKDFSSNYDVLATRVLSVLSQRHQTYLAWMKTIPYICICMPAVFAVSPLPHITDNTTVIHPCSS